jgi:hypothetical protein
MFPSLSASSLLERSGHSSEDVRFRIRLRNFDALPPDPVPLLGVVFERGSLGEDVDPIGELLVRVHTEHNVLLAAATGRGEKRYREGELSSCGGLSSFLSRAEIVRRE